MELRPGTRLESATCDAQFVVVRAPSGTDVDVRCGGSPLEPLGTVTERVGITLTGEAVQIGKRYAEEELGLELLCTRTGEGALTHGEEPLFLMGAKPLPASD
jgi:hypothetical protein